MVDEVRMRLGHCLGSVCCDSFSVFIQLGDTEDIWPIKQLCCLSQKVLLQKKMEADTEEEPANPVSPGKRMSTWWW